jgi:hypothetical protein
VNSGIGRHMAAARVMEGLLFGVQTRDPMVFAAAAVVLIAVAAIATCRRIVLRRWIRCLPCEWSRRTWQQRLNRKCLISVGLSGRSITSISSGPLAESSSGVYSFTHQSIANCCRKAYT